MSNGKEFALVGRRKALDLVFTDYEQTKLNGSVVEETRIDRLNCTPDHTPDA